MALTDKIGSISRLNFDDLYNSFLSLEKKQQLGVAAVVVVLVLVLLFLPVSCVGSKLSAKKEAYQSHAKTAADFYRVADEYLKIKGRFDTQKQSKSDLGGDPLKTVLYQVADELQIERQRVTPKTVSPVEGNLFTEVGKEVSVRNIRFDQAIQFLSKLIQNTAIPVKVKKLDLQADAKNKQTIRTMTFTLTTLQMKSQK